MKNSQTFLENKLIKRIKELFEINGWDYSRIIRLGTVREMLEVTSRGAVFWNFDVAIKVLEYWPGKEDYSVNFRVEVWVDVGRDMDLVAEVNQCIRAQLIPAMELEELKHGGCPVVDKYGTAKFIKTTVETEDYATKTVIHKHIFDFCVHDDSYNMGDLIFNLEKAGMEETE